MTNASLPTKLGKEPLIDVVCEVRFEAIAPASALLPGLIISQLGGRKSEFEALPLGQVPQVFRDQDPNLRHAAIIRITVDDRFAILISDRSIAVACKMPYVGWAAFKEMIVFIFSILKGAAFITSVERHSLKYVDLFQSSEKPTLARFNVAVELAGHRVSSELINLRTEIPQGPFVHATTIASPASVTHIADGVTRTGALIDVDTHRIHRFNSASKFIEALPDMLEEIHDANKAFFFSLLSDSGLKELEPKYD